MAVTEAAQTISNFEKKVMWRERLLALQDGVALTLLVGGLASAPVVLYLRLRPSDLSSGLAIAAIFAVVLTAAMTRWLLKRKTEQDASFLIDRTLNLEDRVATAHSIIRREGPKRLVEEAMVEDAAGRIASAQPSTVVPYKLPRWYALSLICLIALFAAMLVPQKTLPGGDEIAAEQAEIKVAGEQLEQAAAEVEQIAPPESRTANLAREQAELGRALRRSTDTRAEALKKLSALEARIRQRHDELASTRADEIVSLAEQRFRSALSAAPKDRPKPAPMAKDNPADLKATGPEGNASPASSEAAPTPSGGDGKKDNKSLPRQPEAIASNQQAKEAGDKNPSSNQEAAKNQQPQQQRPAGETEGRTDIAANKKGAPAKPASSPDARGGQEQGQGATGNASEVKESAGKDSTEAEQPQSGEALNNPLTDMVADQAGKVLPNLSEQLLDQAAQLRADQLTPERIRQMAQAAQFLAKDLAKIAQSKEFQQAVEQLAQQVNPETLEQVARQLANQEKLRQELEAAGRLLMQNQQVKQMVAGLAQTFEQMGERIEQKMGGNRDDQPGGDDSPPGPGAQQRAGGGKGTRGGRNKSRGEDQRLNSSIAPTAQGRQTSVGGNMKRADGGEYLYLEAKPGAGAVRAPYSSSYPQYRREAERSVERSQVPSRMRSMVRQYFDAINPDAKKQR